MIKYVQGINMNTIKRLIEKLRGGKINEETSQKLINESKQKNYFKRPLDISELISKLERLGYYKYANPEKIKEIKAKSIEDGYIYGWEDSKRDFKSDSEDLAEGDIGKFIKEVEPFLKHEKVKITDLQDNISDKGYTVTVNGTNYVIYTEKELKDDNIWKLATERCFGIINSLLKNVESKERIFILYGGNDLRGIFLTEEMYKEIIEFKEEDPKYKPHKAPEY